CDTGLDSAVSFVVGELQHPGTGHVDRECLTIVGHIGAFEGRNAYGLEQSCCKLEPEYVRVGSHIISDVIVGAAKPEPPAFPTRIRTDSAVSTAGREVA